MPWSNQWTDRAVRDLAGLDVAVARRIVAKLEQAAENPLHFFARLAGSDEFKLRIGPTGCSRCCHTASGPSSSSVSATVPASTAGDRLPVRPASPSTGSRPSRAVEGEWRVEPVLVRELPVPVVVVQAEPLRLRDDGR